MFRKQLKLHIISDNILCVFVKRYIHVHIASCSFISLPKKQSSNVRRMCCLDNCCQQVNKFPATGFTFHIVLINVIFKSSSSS